MIIAFTGHRPDKLPNKETGYKLPNPTYIQVCHETQKLLLELKPEKCISGMAIGYDLYAAFVCLKLGIPYVSAIPFVGQEKMWPQETQKIYHRILEKAAEAVVVSEGGYAAQKMQIRNEWMIDHCDQVLACWDGSNGGTYNCIKYAQSQNKLIHYITPLTKGDNYIG